MYTYLHSRSLHCALPISSLSADPAYGGQVLPFIVELWLDEMLSAANLSFGLFPGLTRGAAEAIAAHATDELKALYLPRMISGEWSGAMALTESGDRKSTRLNSSH